MHVDSAVEALARGGMIVVTTDAGAGHLVMAAERATREKVAFYLRHSSGLLGAALDPVHDDAFSVGPSGVPLDVIAGTTDGVSAGDRAATLRALASAAAHRGQFRAPGHVLVAATRFGGVLERPGHAEAAVDLVAMAGSAPVAAVVPVVGASGRAASAPELERWRRANRLPLVRVSEVIEHRARAARVLTAARGS
jgi:3,4-dihydroxy-2-butanone 4-phosphate synthase